jgi:hypothetical protein
MGFRFSRSVRFFPGVRLDVSTFAVSTSFGPCCAWYTLSASGQQQVMLGLPDTSLRHTQSLPAVKIHASGRLLILLLLAVACFLAAQLAGCEHGNKQAIRLVWSAPTANSDGSTPVTPLASYNVYAGPNATALIKVANVPAAATMSITLRLPSRPCVVAMSAVSASGVESERTPAVACPPGSDAGK